ncbi:MAG: hypothetical protein ABSE41_15210 [Bacteroidota bacterium]
MSLSDFREIFGSAFTVALSGIQRNASTGHASKQSPQPVQFDETTTAVLLYLCRGRPSITIASKKQIGGQRSQAMHFSSTTSAIGGYSFTNGGGRGGKPGYFAWSFPTTDSRDLNIADVCTLR